MCFALTQLSKWNRVWLIFSLLACLLTDVAFGQQTVRVIVLPFKIHAQEELSYLQQQIPQAIKTQLEQEGAKVLIIDQESLESRNMQADNLEDIRELSLQIGTDYVVWGSLTWIGQNFSLDAKLLSPTEGEKPRVFDGSYEEI